MHMSAAPITAAVCLAVNTISNEMLAAAVPDLHWMGQGGRGTGVCFCDVDDAHVGTLHHLHFDRTLVGRSVDGSLDGLMDEGQKRVLER